MPAVRREERDDDAFRTDQLTHARRDDEATTTGDNGTVRRQQAFDDLALEGAEMLFAVLSEDVGDRNTGQFLDQFVGVVETAAPTLGQLASERGLPRAHESGED